MAKLSRPVTIAGFTLRGVDDWQAFCTDQQGNWYSYYTECSPMWRSLPKAFIGDCGYPDSDAGVLATAILEAQAGFKPTRLDDDCVAEISALFG